MEKFEEEDSQITDVEKILKTVVFDGKTLEDIFTVLYKNIESDRKIATDVVSEIRSIIAENPDNLSYLKLQEIKQLQESNIQLLKLVGLMKDILLKKTKPSAIAGFLISEQEKLSLIDDSEVPQIEEGNIEEEYDEL